MSELQILTLSLDKLKKMAKTLGLESPVDVMETALSILECAIEHNDTMIHLDDKEDGTKQLFRVKFIPGRTTEKLVGGEHRWEKVQE